MWYGILLKPGRGKASELGSGGLSVMWTKKRKKKLARYTGFGFNAAGSPVFAELLTSLVTMGKSPGIPIRILNYKGWVG